MVTYKEKAVGGNEMKMFQEMMARKKHKGKKIQATVAKGRQEEAGQEKTPNK